MLGASSLAFQRVALARVAASSLGTAAPQLLKLDDFRLEILDLAPELI
ncbi:MAG: hypothetical protein NTX57_05860 [Armatimonadetes bacterium]|nr:hypothetical protein [Armatimonadota bacterium]